MAIEATETDKDETRKARILAALAVEIERQSEEERTHAPFVSQRFGYNEYVIDGTINLEALAAAVERALDEPGDAPLQEGKSPDELNAPNDD